MFTLPDILVTKWVRQGQPRLRDCVIDYVNRKTRALVTVQGELITIWGP